MHSTPRPYRIVINMQLIIVILLIVKIMIQLQHVPSPYKNAVSLNPEHVPIIRLAHDTALLDNYTMNQPF